MFVTRITLRSASRNSQTSFEEIYARKRPSIDQSVGIFRRVALQKKDWGANHSKPELVQVTHLVKKDDRASVGRPLRQALAPVIVVKRVVSSRTKSRTEMSVLGKGPSSHATYLSSFDNSGFT